VKFRYVFAVFGFMLLAIIYGLKVNLSVAMVGMRNVTAEESNPLNITQSDCAGDLSENRTIEVSFHKAVSQEGFVRSGTHTLKNMNALLS